MLPHKASWLLLRLIVLTLSVSSGVVIISETVAAAADDAAVTTYGEGISFSGTRDRLAVGLVHTSFVSRDARGQVQGDVLEADLGSSRLAVDYLEPGVVSARAPLSAQLGGRRAVAAVNGDFFDIDDTGAPMGLGIDPEHGLLHGPAAGWNNAAVITRDGRGGLDEVFFDGAMTLPGGEELALSYLNSPQVSPGGIGLYTSAWGPVPRVRVVDDVPDAREVLIRDGRVVSVAASPGTSRLAAGETALIGREHGAAVLAGLDLGDAVDVRYGARSDTADIAVAITGNKVLVHDRAIVALGDDHPAPRTAIGFSADGRRMILLTVDGRQAESRGLSEWETAALMRGLGADDALNLDGGGSSTMLAREDDEAALRVVNSPSEGAERHIANGLGLFTAP